MSLCRGHTLYSSVSSTRGSQIMHYKSQFVKVGAGVYGFLAPEKRFRLELSKCVTSEWRIHFRLELGRSMVYPGILFGGGGGSTNSVEDRENGDLGAVAS